MSFPARYPGRCAACDERIHVGDDIRMTDDTTPTQFQPWRTRQI